MSVFVAIGCLLLAALCMFNQVAHSNYCTKERFLGNFLAILKNIFEEQPKAIESDLPITEIICYHGYPVESYDVETEDGYLLTIHRIPYGKNGKPETSQKPVIVQHGILCSSAIWVINPPEKNLAYILADAGYDVWLTNIRGNEYGREHLTLKNDTEEFWDFSWGEMADYDMPAMIDFILEKTAFDKLLYIGHSMGTTMVFAMLASKPEYNEKIAGVMAMAPVVFASNMKSAMTLLVPYAELISQGVTDVFGRGEFLANREILKIFTGIVCAFNPLCATVLFAICGWNKAQLNESGLPIYTSFTPSGSSIRTLLHYVQGYQSGKFRRYDFGKLGNEKIYNQSEPPDYNITAITVPVALFWSDNDLLADTADVAELADELPNVLLNFEVSDPLFSHLDFMWGIDAKTLVYDKVIETMEEVWN